MQADETDDALAEILTLTREVDVYETIRWRNSDGQLHRVHGPAVIHHSGAQHWYMHGLKHRVDGPAIYWPNSDSIWLRSGKRHRTDGPAVIRSTGECQWWLDGQPMSQSEWQLKVRNFHDW